MLYIYIPLLCFFSSFFYTLILNTMNIYYLLVVVILYLIIDLSSIISKKSTEYKLELYNMNESLYQIELLHVYVFLFTRRHMILKYKLFLFILDYYSAILQFRQSLTLFINNRLLLYKTYIYFHLVIYPILINRYSYTFYLKSISLKHKTNVLSKTQLNSFKYKLLFNNKPIFLNKKASLSCVRYTKLMSHYVNC